MIIRMVFEPQKNVNVNHDGMFKFYSENYLSDFNTTWGGYITISSSEMAHSDTIAVQPCYQRYVESSWSTRKQIQWQDTQHTYTQTQKGEMRLK